MMRRSLRNTRQSGSRNSDETPTTEESTTVDDGITTSARPRKTKTKIPKRSTEADGDFSESDAAPAHKKRKVAASASSARNSNRKGDAQLYQRLFGNGSALPPETAAPCNPPSRAHNADYHRPLLLDSRQHRASLLRWFDSVSTARSMPWRKAWIDPRAAPELSSAAELRQRLERRAYEVWISEIMLQQTRVAVVIDYWNRWMAQWPTIQDLAAADPDDVLAAWRGLGYYSRATRIHQAAKIVCGDSQMGGLLPHDVDELVAKVPGVGRYTAGAISAIVFGRAAPMVDGNVLRVLSRQLGVFGDVKADKSVIDLLWAAADGLVKAVAGDLEDDEEEAIGNPEEQANDRPGRWGQALMELGSTICVPKPNCAACPISSSCRAYSEGLQIAVEKGLAPREKKITRRANPPRLDDIEDSCGFCKPFEEFSQDEEGGEDVKSPATTTTTTTKGGTKDNKPRPKNQTTLLQAFAFAPPSPSPSTRAKKPNSSSNSLPDNTLSPAAMDVITAHARKFPVKVAKKAVREEETLVCAIRRAGDGKYLIHRRPAKGLLAGLWEFPSYVLPPGHENTAKARRDDAERYAAGLAAVVVDAKKPGGGGGGGGGSRKSAAKLSRRGLGLRHVGELGSVPWLFSHLRLTMHVHLFELEDGGHHPDSNSTSDGAPGGMPSRWSDAVDDESMGTGMRKCWDLVKEANGH
ncbi:DNA glycosylase [Biscogniauxia mediterranea]|nr:DNA glycosylase [Biscogniauxia mediterranea]